MAESDELDHDALDYLVIALGHDDDDVRRNAAKDFVATARDGRTLVEILGSFVIPEDLRRIIEDETIEKLTTRKWADTTYLRALAQTNAITPLGKEKAFQKLIALYAQRDDGIRYIFELATAAWPTPTAKTSACTMLSALLDLAEEDSRRSSITRHLVRLIAHPDVPEEAKREMSTDLISRFEREATERQWRTLVTVYEVTAMEGNKDFMRQMRDVAAVRMQQTLEGDDVAKIEGIYRHATLGVVSTERVRKRLVDIYSERGNISGLLDVITASAYDRCEEAALCTTFETDIPLTPMNYGKVRTFYTRLKRELSTKTKRAIEKKLLAYCLKEKQMKDRLKELDILQAIVSQQNASRVHRAIRDAIKEKLAQTKQGETATAREANAPEDTSESAQQASETYSARAFLDLAKWVAKRAYGHSSLVDALVRKAAVMNDLPVCWEIIQDRYIAPGNYSTPARNRALTTLVSAESWQVMSERVYDRVIRDKSLRVGLRQRFGQRVAAIYEREGHFEGLRELTNLIDTSEPDKTARKVVSYLRSRIEPTRMRYLQEAARTDNDKLIRLAQGIGIGRFAGVEAEATHLLQVKAKDLAARLY